MFGNNLRYCREELEMTQSELGFIFGVSDASVRSWETAYEPMPLIKLIKFCNLYNYSLDFVCGITRNNSKSSRHFEANKIKIGNKLKQIRKDLGLTQQKLADECKISQTTYSGYETGQFLITSACLYYICKTYNISMDDICS